VHSDIILVAKHYLPKVCLLRKNFSSNHDTINVLKYFTNFNENFRRGRISDNEHLFRFLDCRDPDINDNVNVKKDL